MIGADKFFSFLDPPCSLMGSIPTAVWKLLGVLQLAAGVLIWLPKFRRYVAGFFVIFMLVFTIIHLFAQTYDIGGSIFIAILLGLLVWNPGFLIGKNKTKSFIFAILVMYLKGYNLFINNLIL